VDVNFKLSLEKIESVGQGGAEFSSQGGVEHRMSMSLETLLLVANTE
jgi:hypothetical protein